MSADWVAAIGQVIGAVFTAAAVVVALAVALRDGRRQRSDEERRARAQARLVIVSQGKAGLREIYRDDTLLSAADFTVENLSDRPIFDVWAAADLLDPANPERVECAMSIRKARTENLRSGQSALATAVSAEVRDAAMLAWRVGWTDADGRFWCLSGAPDEERRLTQRPRT